MAHGPIVVKENITLSFHIGGPAVKIFVTYVRQSEVHAFVPNVIMRTINGHYVTSKASQRFKVRFRGLHLWSLRAIDVTCQSDVTHTNI